MSEVAPTSHGTVSEHPVQVPHQGDATGNLNDTTAHRGDTDPHRSATVPHTQDKNSDRSDTVAYRPGPGEIPTTPGVYRFRGPDNRVLYVGKAKNLRTRLSNYFAPLHSLPERTRHMVTSATSVEWTVVTTESESLQLEIALINELHPPFNVQFKDDKSYPYLVITLGEDAPRVFVTRKRNIPGARYFGPYPKMWTVTESLELLLKLFPIRTCKDSDYRRAMQTGKPCFAGQIKRCFGPCSHRVTIAEHRDTVDRFIAFMQNQDTRILDDLTRRMRTAAECHHYEEAAVLRDQLHAATTFFEKSAVVLGDRVDVDVFGIANDELAAAVHLFVVRAGRVRSVHSWTVDKELDVPLSDLIDQTLQNAYRDDHTPPGEIVLPELPDDASVLEEWLSAAAGRRVHLRQAQRGDKAALLETATRNAEQTLMLYKTRRTADFTSRTRALEDLQHALGMLNAPLRIECYDVSHLGGTNIVASMVVFEDALPRKDEYRRFTVAQSRDDTDSIYQVLTRRLAYLREPENATGDSPLSNPELNAVLAQADAALTPPAGLVPGSLAVSKPAAPTESTGTAAPTESTGTAAPTESTGTAAPTRRNKFAYRPNLLMVDGGEPQLAAAARALAESGVRGIQLCSIAKRLEELWLPDSDYPVILPRNSEALFLVQRLRDEAHRAAITHQRQRRSRDLSTSLRDIPGLGPTRSSRLLAHFGSVNRLRRANIADIAEVAGIGPQLAAAIHAHLNPAR